MGSFYVACSVTGQTIADGQEMIVQFMLPGTSPGKDPSIGQVFVDSFLRVAKQKGLKEALKSFEESTKTWGSANELGQKGIIVSDGRSKDWIPFGPAIRGFYDDCGHIQVSEDEENKKRISVLEGLMFGIPFQSIMGLSTDDRWYTYGLKENDSSWKLDGVDENLPEAALMLCKMLSVTYMHASVYDTISSYDFSPNDGVQKSKYDKEWKDEYLKEVDKLPSLFKKVKSKNSLSKLSYYDLDLSIFKGLKNDLALIYLACMARENVSFDWIKETMCTTYSLRGMHLKLQPSVYASQEPNWRGWNRIYDALNPKIHETMVEYGYFNTEDDEN